MTILTLDEKCKLIEGYELDSQGHITSPGKFEAEPWQILWFYDMMMVSGQDYDVYPHDDTEDEDTEDEDMVEDGIPIAIFKLTDEDRANLELAPEDRWASVYEDEQGFCSLSLWRELPEELRE